MHQIIPASNGQEVPIVEKARLEYNASQQMQVGDGVNRRKMASWRISLVAFLVGLGCWAGLAYLVTYYVPDSSTVTLSLFLIFVAVAGTAMPVFHLLNWRFRREADAEEGASTDAWRAARQSALASAFVVLCMWFQLLKVLNWLIVLLLVGVFALVEVFFWARRT